MDHSDIALEVSALYWTPQRYCTLWWHYFWAQLLLKEELPVYFVTVS